MTARDDQVGSQKTPDQILAEGFVGDVIFCIVFLLAFAYILIRNL